MPDARLEAAPSVRPTRRKPATDGQRRDRGRSRPVGASPSPEAACYRSDRSRSCSSHATPSGVSAQPPSVEPHARARRPPATGGSAACACRRARGRSRRRCRPPRRRRPASPPERSHSASSTWARSRRLIARSSQTRHLRPAQPSRQASCAAPAIGHRPAHAAGGVEHAQLAGTQRRRDDAAARRARRCRSPAGCAARRRTRPSSSA